MAPQPIVTGLSPKEGPPGTRIIIRGEFLGTRQSDLKGLTICGCDCLLSAEWKSPNKIIARTGPAKCKGDVIVTTISGGVGSSTIQFRAYHETIGPIKESAVWVEESSIQSLAWGRRTLATSGYTQEDPLGLSIEGHDKKFTDDLQDIFSEASGDLSQENFSPRWFLLENHHSTSFEDLKAGLAYLKRKVESQKEGQLSFLKSNAGSVIDQLDTLMIIREKFQENVKKYGDQPLLPLEKSIYESMKGSKSIFDEVLQRREKADSTRSALFAISRHNFLFCLPNSIDRNAKTEDYDVIVNDYSRAKNLFGRTEVPVFRKVLKEVNIRVLEVRKKLHEKMIKMPQTIDQQKKYIKALINLEAQQTEGEVTEKLKFIDPAWDAIEARAKYLEQTFTQIFDLYCAKDSISDKTKSRDLNSTPNRVLFCEEISDVAASQLPDLWQLGQSYFTGELRGGNDPKHFEFKHIILNGIKSYCFYLRAAVLQSNDQKNTTAVSWPNNSLSFISQWLPQCLRYMRISYATLIRQDLPREALDIFQKLIDNVRLFCFTIIFKRAIEQVEKLKEKETWIMSVEDFPGATMLFSLIEDIVVDTLEELQSVCMYPEIREGNLLEPNSEGEREILKLLQELLLKICSIIEELAYQAHDDDIPVSNISQLIGSPNPHQNTQQIKTCNSIMSMERRMLCCLANCLYCKNYFFEHIGSVFVKYSYPYPKLALETARESVSDLFTCNLLEAFVEIKSDPLVGTIEPSMYIGKFQWDKVKEVIGIRPYANECCDNLVGVFSEIFAISPALLRPVLEKVIQTVAEELARLMSCVQTFNRNGAIQANVDIRLIRDAVQFYSTETARCFFSEALEVISPLSVEEDRKVENILYIVKKRMKLHLLCLSEQNKISGL